MEGGNDSFVIRFELICVASSLLEGSRKYDSRAELRSVRFSMSFGHNLAIEHNANFPFALKIAVCTDHSLEKFK